jgi:hypothetical protein
VASAASEFPKTTVFGAASRQKAAECERPLGGKRPPERSFALRGERSVELGKLAELLFDLAASGVVDCASVESTAVQSAFRFLPLILDGLPSHF